MEKEMNWPFMIFVLVISVFCTFYLDNNTNEANEVEDVMKVGFNGEVEVVENSRGFKVILKGDTHIYRLSGAAKDTLRLVDHIQWGDSLRKVRGSKILYLKSRATGKVTEWHLYDR